MSHKNSSLLPSTGEIDECQLALSGNQALEDAFRRIEDDSHFSSGIPKITNYDDYVYPDAGDHSDNGNN